VALFPPGSFTSKTPNLGAIEDTIQLPLNLPVKTGVSFMMAENNSKMTPDSKS
jgi:hypothetical protein